MRRIKILHLRCYWSPIKFSIDKITQIYKFITNAVLVSLLPHIILKNSSAMCTIEINNPYWQLDTWKGGPPWIKKSWVAPPMNTLSTPVEPKE